MSTRGFHGGVAASTLLLAAAGCKLAAADNLTKAEARLEARGIEVYQEQHCGICHTLTRAGTGGIFGPSHDGVATHAEARIHDAAYRGEATTVAGYIRESVQNPGAYRVPGYEHTRFTMPRYSELSKEDLDALVFMLSHEREHD